MNPIAAQWKRLLAESVRNGLLVAGCRAALPLAITVSAAYKNRGNAADVQNLLEIICDAVQEGTGLNDLDYETHALRPTFDSSAPTITIVVRARRATPPGAAPPDEATATITRRKGVERRDQHGRTEHAPSIPRRRHAVKPRRPD
jgi:hypothetical protein